MIKNYKQFNESLINKLEGPNEEQIWDYLNGLKLNPNDLLIKSSESGFLPGVKKALDNGANINYSNELALYQAVSNSFYDVVKYLIENGANIEGENNDVLKSALLSHDVDILKLLLDNSKHTFNVDELITLARGLKEYQMVDMLEIYKKQNIKNG